MVRDPVSAAWVTVKYSRPGAVIDAAGQQSSFKQYLKIDRGF
jgi:hypothetical protein